MAPFTPLPLVDDFLLPYNAGQALFLVFVLVVLGTLPLKSRKLLSLNFVLFGLVFALTPTSEAPLHFRFLGLALLLVGPVLYATARR